MTRRTRFKLLQDQCVSTLTTRDMKDMNDPINPEAKASRSDGFSLSEMDLKRGVDAILEATATLATGPTKKQRPVRQMPRYLLPLLAASVMGGLAFFGSLWLMQAEQCETFACLLESEIEMISTEDLLDAALYDELWMEVAMEELNGLQNLDNFEGLELHLDLHKEHPSIER
jgi:hypothetical protein